MDRVPPALEVQGLARTLNEILILATLQSGLKHGYQIALQVEERSDGCFSFNHGTLYPILHQLEKDGLIDGNWDKGRGRRKRKEYVLTPAGRAYLEQQTGQWNRLHENLSAFLVASAPVRARAASDR